MAINAANIAGNRPEDRLKQLRRCWETVTSGALDLPVFSDFLARSLLKVFASSSGMLTAVPGFFKPRLIPPAWKFDGSAATLSYCDTSPPETTPRDVVDLTI